MTEPQQMPPARPNLHVLDVPDRERFVRRAAGVVRKRSRRFDGLVTTHLRLERLFFAGVRMTSRPAILCWT